MFQEEFIKNFLILIVSLLFVYVGYCLDTGGLDTMGADHLIETGNQFGWTILGVVCAVFVSRSAATKLHSAATTMAGQTPGTSSSQDKVPADNK